MAKRTTNQNIIEYYLSQTTTSDPSQFIGFYVNLPSELDKLCRTVQGLMAHRDGSKEFYGFEVSEDRKQEADLRYVEKIIEKLLELDTSSLTVKRPPEKRVFGTCRDFALLLCSMLRHQKIPARLRCGFSAYFEKNFYIDHWVCEYWNKDKKRWILVDAELGEEVLKVYPVDFSPLDIPRDKFLLAGKAWQMFRQKEVDPNLFGVPWIGIKGAWFIRSNLLRDVAALNKVELLPWDYTKFADKQFSNLSELDKNEVEFLDKLARLTTISTNAAFYQIRDLYESDNRLKVGKKIKSYTFTGPKEIVLE